MGTLLRIAVVVVLAAIGGEFLSPPLSCWIVKFTSPGAGGVGAGAMTVMQPGGGVGVAILSLAETPALTSGEACRARILGGLGLR